MLRLTPTLPVLRQLLHDFAASSNTFKLIYSTHPVNPASAESVSALHILDSSFNPPTLAHLSLALCSKPPRLLLLLATENADKPPAPASYEDRLSMMFALLPAFDKDLPVDIAVTKKARFVDKAAAVAEAYSQKTVGEEEGNEAGGYTTVAKEKEALWKGPEQTYLTGYDTLVRLLDKKYYLDSKGGMDVLESFWETSKVVAMARDGYGEAEEMQRLIDGLKKERPSWAERIKIVEASEMAVGVSSTVVRKAVKEGDEETLGRCLTAEVREWIKERKLYEE